jgi:hypothetical protein
MSRQIKIECFAFSECFQAELQKLQPGVIKAVKEALELRQNNPSEKKPSPPSTDWATQA